MVKKRFYGAIFGKYEMNYLTKFDLYIDNV